MHLLLRQKRAEREEEWIPISVNGFLNTQNAETDDQGNYRLSGLASGEYVVQVDLDLARTEYNISKDSQGTSTNSQYSLPIYSAGAFRRKDAPSTTVKLGDQRGGEDIQIALSKIHSVSGMILASRDGHIVNGGSAALPNADDKTEVAKTSLTKDGTNFTFTFVPEGDYVIRTKEARMWITKRS